MRRPCPVYWGLLWESTPSITLKRLPNDGHSCNHAQLKHFTPGFFVLTDYHPSRKERNSTSALAFRVKNVFYCHHLVLSDCESVFLAVAAGVIEVGRRQEAAQSCQFVVESFFVWRFFTLPLSGKWQLVEFWILLINCEKTWFDFVSVLKLKNL